jgi:lysophospholipase L1-like esterase
MLRRHGMKTLKIALIAGLAFVLLSAPSVAQVDTGSADFTVYASLGDSLASGFSSGSLHTDGQALSFPSLISLQARGPIPFEQPLVLDPGIPNILTLQSLSPLVIAPKPGQGAPVNLNLPRPYDNMAVPGARIGDVVRTRTGGLHDLVLRGLGTQLELVAALQPTFVSIWIGNNDILAAATSGIVIEGITLTPAAQFEADLRTIVGTMSAVGTQALAIATLPSVVAIPYVTTIPPVVVNPATNEPVLTPDGQLVWLIGPDGQLGPGDHVLLPASADLARGIGIPRFLGGTGQPLSDGVVLSAAETATIEGRREELNAIIRTVAGEANAALVDASAIFDQVLQRGILLGGITLTTDYLTGGLFSYDGVHASPIGYAIVANAFIDAVNATYGAAIPGIAMDAFLLGGLGRLPGIGRGAVAATEGPFIFSARAERSLRRVLDIPKERKLLRIKQRRERRAGSVMARSARESLSSKAERRELRRQQRERRLALRQL